MGRSALEEVQYVEVAELGPDRLGSSQDKPRIWLSTWVRALRADIRATRKTRMDSTFPSLDLASPPPSPDWAARAALMASSGSDFS